MTIKRNGQNYELVELHELNQNATYDIVAIFKINYIKENDDQAAQVWELGDFVNYFYGANDDTENIINIANEYIDEFNFANVGIVKKVKKSDNLKRLLRAKKIISLLGDANCRQDTCELVEELENLLPFNNQKEHSDWIDLTLSFKFWEDWESKTLEIAQRLEK